MDPTERTERTHWRTPIDRTDGDDESEDLVVTLRGLPDYGGKPGVQVFGDLRSRVLTLAEVEALRDELHAAAVDAQVRS